MKLLLKNCDIVASTPDGFHVIKNGYCGIDGERICALSSTRPDEKYDEERDLAGKTLYPGLINTHCHSPMTLLRGLGSDLPLREWLFDNMFPTEDRLRAEDIRAGSDLAIMEMLSTGTVSFSDMYYFSEETIAAVAQSGIKANISRPVQAFDPDEPYEKNHRARESLELYRRFNASSGGRVLVDCAIHAEYTCNTMIARRFSEDCAAAGAGMHIHLSETQSEHEECIARHGKSPARWFHDAGAFNGRTLAAHCVCCTKEDLELMKQRGVHPVHCPSSNMKLGSGFAPIPEMLGMGIAVGLGTDGAASNNNLNMIEELHLATIIHNGRRCDPVIMKPHETLAMATTNGAIIQGRPDCGGIAIGNRADIIAVSFDGPHMIPDLDPIAMLCYSAQGSDVYMTMVDGKILYLDGEFTTIDRDRVMAAVKRSLSYIYG